MHPARTEALLDRGRAAARPGAAAGPTTGLTCFYSSTTPSPGTDVHAIREGRISVTLLTLDSTAPAAAPALAAFLRD